MVFRHHHLEILHRFADIIGGSLDVVVRRGAHIRMAKDSLNHHWWYAEAIQVAPEPASCCMPPVPLRQSRISREDVIGLDVVPAL